jgi:alpha-L-fucosidase
LAYGLFLHWGLYSQLGRGEWIQHAEQIPVEEYAKLKDTFTAADFDARAIARLAKDAGMKYITLTTRHHDGFSLYDTRGLSDFDAPHSPAGRDLVAEFVEACRAEGIVPFFYHTTLDWRFDSWHCSDEEFAAYLEYLHASVEVLCKHYGEIGGLWFDGNWSRRDADWREDRLYGIIRKHQPKAMIINNTGLGARGVLGHPEIDSTTFEQGLPAAPNREGWPKYVAGEMCQTMSAYWGIGFDDFSYMSPREVIENLCACRKVGANYLLNVGPTATGAIPAYEAATLRRVGEWIAQNAVPIYDGKPVAIGCQGRDFVLEADGAWYYFAHGLARGGSAHVVSSDGGAGPRAMTGVKTQIQSAQWLDSGEELAFVQDTDSGIAALNCTVYPYGTNRVVRVARLERS